MKEGNAEERDRKVEGYETLNPGLGDNEHPDTNENKRNDGPNELPPSAGVYEEGRFSISHCALPLHCTRELRSKHERTSNSDRSHHLL
jgi:hypothetical protein